MSGGHRRGVFILFVAEHPMPVREGIWFKKQKEHYVQGRILQFDDINFLPTSLDGEYRGSVGAMMANTPEVLVMVEDGQSRDVLE